MILRILLAAAAFAGLSVPAAAQGCQRSLAPTVTFAQAIGEDRPSTHCVEIEGVVVGRLLVEDDRARYRQERIRNHPSSTGAALGFYSETYFDEPTRVRVVGRLSDCSTEQASAEAEDPSAIVMMTGFCHYWGGRVIFAAHVEPLGPARFSRLLPGDAGDLGNLAPLETGDTRRTMDAAATRFLDALRSGDRNALAAMHGSGPDGRRDPRELDRVLALLLDSPDSPFAGLRGDAPRVTEIFGWKVPLWADTDWEEDIAETGTADAIACFSTSRDAAMLWPIDSRDADNIPGRPYACTRIHITGEGADARVSFDTEQAEEGVEEPIVISGMRDRVIHEL